MFIFLIGTCFANYNLFSLLQHLTLIVFFDWWNSFDVCGIYIFWTFDYTWRNFYNLIKLEWMMEISKLEIFSKLLIAVDGSIESLRGFINDNQHLGRWEFRVVWHLLIKYFWYEHFVTEQRGSDRRLFTIF